MHWPEAVTVVAATIKSYHDRKKLAKAAEKAKNNNTPNGPVSASDTIVDLARPAEAATEPGNINQQEDDNLEVAETELEKRSPEDIML